MIDAWRPMTRLLGAICVWALLLLALIAGGLGNHFPEPAKLSAATPPMPTLIAMKTRLGPPADYLEVGSRPLLMPDRRPGIVTANGGQAGAGDLDVSLTSVLMTPTLQMVILTGNQDGRSLRVRLGDTAEGSNWRLIRLEPRRATFERPTGEVTLELRVFDGKAGAAVQADGARAPTAQTEAPQPGNNPEAPIATPPPPPPPSNPEAAQSPQAATQAQQIEAIRRRIEARRAQMRAAAAASDSEDHH